MSAAERFEAGLRAFRETPGATLIDVRTPEEYAGGHVPGSVNLPLNEIEDYDGDGPLFVYCETGARSAQACALLREMDIEAEDLGGIISYRGARES